MTNADILKRDIRNFLVKLNDTPEVYFRNDCKESREFLREIYKEENELAGRFIEETSHNPEFISSFEYFKPMELVVDGNETEGKTNVNITVSLFLKNENGNLMLDSIYVPFGKAEDGKDLSFCFAPQNVDRQNYYDDTMKKFFEQNLDNMDIIIFDEKGNNGKMVRMSLSDVEDLLSKERIKNAVKIVNSSELSFEEKFSFDIQAGRYTTEQIRDFIKNPTFEEWKYTDKETKKWQKEANKALDKIEKQAEKDNSGFEL